MKMARGCKGKHSGSFKPGRSANPGGQPRTPKEVQQVRQMSALEFSRAISKFLFLTKPKLIEALKDPEINCMEALVGNMVARSINDGDVIRAQFLLDRCVGKVKETLEIKHEFDEMPTEKLIAMAQDAIKVLQDHRQQQTPLMIEAEYERT
jgi:hypothetical protein